MLLCHIFIETTTFVYKTFHLTIFMEVTRVNLKPTMTVFLRTFVTCIDIDMCVF